MTAFYHINSCSFVGKLFRNSNPNFTAAKIWPQIQANRSELPQLEWLQSSPQTSETVKFKLKALRSSFSFILSFVFLHVFSSNDIPAVSCGDFHAEVPRDCHFLQWPLPRWSPPDFSPMPAVLRSDPVFLNGTERHTDLQPSSALQLTPSFRDSSNANRRPSAIVSASTPRKPFDE